MNHKNKTVRRMMTKEGFPVKVWINRKTGGILPTHWKQQAGALSNNTQMKREAKRG